jgi:hypothetical protein
VRSAAAGFTEESFTALLPPAFAMTQKLACAGAGSHSEFITVFGLDPQSIADRVKASEESSRVPTLGQSVVHGMIGFTLVSLGGFAPWVLAGRWFYRNTGEAGLYGTCAVVFMGLSGLVLHRLIIGPASLLRFYKIFSLAFLAYSIAWTIGWMVLRGDVGSVVGLLAGTAAMGAILALAFGACNEMFKVVALLFASNALGYFIGQWAEKTLLATNVTLAKASWGLFYGLGFGAGIGLAFHACQRAARKLIADQR